jgi:iron complex transport system ATP-binding protein
MSQVLRFSSASLVREGRTVLDSIDWEVTSDQRWVVLGANGAGKTSLLELASGWELPSSGSVVVLGDDLASADLEELRPRVGLASPGMFKRIPGSESVSDSVVTAAYAAAERRGEVFDEIDIRRARRVLAEWRLDGLIERAVKSLSEGESKRLQIARSIMTDPELLLLDEPSAGLDLGSREEILLMLSSFAGNPSAPAIVLVTHHVEEIPRGFTHALLLRGGAVAAAGEIGNVVTSQNLSDAFGLRVSVSLENGRFFAQASL